MAQDDSALWRSKRAVEKQKSLTACMGHGSHSGDENPQDTSITAMLGHGSHPPRRKVSTKQENFTKMVGH